MATLIFTALGSLIGGPLGGAIGAIAGRQVDALLLGGGTREGPRLNELSVTTSSYGMPIPRQFGRMRVAGQIIWATDLIEHKDKHGNGKGRPSTVEYTYTASFAVALSSRPIADVGRIWADGKLLRGAGGDLKVAGKFRLYTGHADQAADPILTAAEAQGKCPAYRGFAYVVFEDLQLGDYGNRIPALTFEVIADNGELSVATLLDGVLADCDAQVALAGLEGISGEGAIGELLNALDPLFPMDCDACDALLTIRPDRHQVVPIALPEAATSHSRDDFGGNAGFARRRTPPGEQPVSVLRYYDIGRDYQPGVQRASGRPLPGQPRAVELPGALTAQAARQLVEHAAKRVQWARQLISWRVTQLDPAVRPGAVVTLPNHPGIWRIRDWEWREHGVDLTLARLSPAVDPVGASDPGRANSPPDQTVATTALAAFELPWDGNQASPVPLLVAAASSPNPSWGGASLFVDQGDGALLPLGTSGRARSTIGHAIDVLAAASPLLFDRHSAVTVQLIGEDMVLFDATMRQLSMGANRAMLGGEIFQFASALPLGSGRWRLSGLLRGRAGTESAVASHAANDAFVLLDGSGAVLDPQAVGSVPGTIIAAIGLGDNEPVTAPLTLSGIGLRPPCPVHGRLTVDVSGNCLLTWVRRARGGWLWQDGVDTPLNEQTESYAVAFGPPANPLARWETTAPSLVVPITQLAPLLASAPNGPFAVRQRGDRGMSEPLLVPHP